MNRRIIERDGMECCIIADTEGVDLYLGRDKVTGHSILPATARRLMWFLLRWWVASWFGLRGPYGRWRGQRAGKLSALLLVLLVGCATVPATFKPYNEAPVLQAWLAAGLPVGDCGSLDVRVQSYPDVVSLKRDCHGADGGCTEREVVGFLGTGDVYLIRFTTGNPNRDPVWLLAHELTHVFAWCGLGQADSKHTDTRLWNHYDTVQQVWVDGVESKFHTLLVPVVVHGQ